MYRIIISDHFKGIIKRYVRKYPNFKSDLIKSLECFNKEQAISLGNKLYKIRLKSSDIPRGKSKSFRMIILVVEIENLLTPIVVYFKGDRGDMSDEEINRHLDAIIWELDLKI